MRPNGVLIQGLDLVAAGRPGVLRAGGAAGMLKCSVLSRSCAAGSGGSFGSMSLRHAGSVSCGRMLSEVRSEDLL